MVPAKWLPAVHASSDKSPQIWFYASPGPFRPSRSDAECTWFSSYTRRGVQIGINEVLTRVLGSLVACQIEYLRHHYESYTCNRVLALSLSCLKCALCGRSKQLRRGMPLTCTVKALFVETMLSILLYIADGGLKASAVCLCYIKHESICARDTEVWRHNSRLSQETSLLKEKTPAIG